MDRRTKGNVLPPAIGAITRSMKHAPDGSGFLHLARDGVLRAWDSQGKVVDYRQLSNEEVMLFIKATDHENAIEYEEWESVDGRKVTDAKALWEPEERIRPRGLDLEEEMEKDKDKEEDMGKDMGKDKEEDSRLGSATQPDT